MPTPDSRPRRARMVSAAVGIGVSIGLLLWALRGVSVTEVLQHLRGADPVPLAVAVAVATLTFPLRLVRWRLLLQDQEGHPYPAAPLWHAIALGFTANNVLPLRAGELVRTYAASRLAGARFSTVFSSVAVERIFDALTIVALLALALLSPDLPSGLTVGGQSVASLARAGAIAAIAGLVAATLVVAAPLAAERIIGRLLPPRSGGRLVRLIEGIRQGLLVLRTPRRLAAVILWSVVLWLVNALGFYIAFAAFDIPVSYLGALLLQGLLILGISLPSTPGFFGPFEAVIVAVLALYGVPNDVAFSYAIAFHVTSFIPITLLGLWSLARNPGAFHPLRQAPA
ncbi:MAG: lysylphosphatidylglycerol synthase transmembrane domain-containing protein [Gemmatimonadales bacterium]